MRVIFLEAILKLYCWDILICPGTYQQLTIKEVFMSQAINY